MGTRKPIRTLNLGKRGDDLTGLLFRFGGLTATQYAQLMERPNQNDIERGRMASMVGKEIRTQAEELVSAGCVSIDPRTGVAQVTDASGSTHTVVDGECSCPVTGSCAHRAAAALVLDNPLRGTQLTEEVGR